MTVFVNTTAPRIVQCVRSDCRLQMPYEQAQHLLLGNRFFHICTQCWSTWPMSKIEQSCRLHPDRGDPIP